MRSGVSAPLDTCTAPLKFAEKYVAVDFLTHQTKYYVVQSKSRVRDLFEAVCQYLTGLGMVETQLFGLAILSDNEYIFSDPENKLSKYAPKYWKSSSGPSLDPTGRPILKFHLRVQFYLEAHHHIRDPFTRHHYYLQLRENVLIYDQVRCEDTYFLLAALALQADLGDYTDAPDTDYFDPGQFFPSWMIKQVGPDYIQEHLPALHRAHRGLMPGEAQSHYIAEASSPDSPHNLHLYHLKRKKQGSQGSVTMAVCTKGLHIFQEDLEGDRQQVADFLWPDIGKLYFERKKFEIRGVRNPENQKLTYYTSNDEKAKHLLYLCKRTHQFSMAIQVRLAEARRREEEEQSQYEDSYVYSESLDLGWDQDGDYSCLSEGGKSQSDQRISVISNTSSNTTSGIVSDKVHSLDESEDDLEIEIMINSPPAPSVESLAFAHLQDTSDPYDLSSELEQSPTTFQSQEVDVNTTPIPTSESLPPKLSLSSSSTPAEEMMTASSTSSSQAVTASPGPNTSLHSDSTVGTGMSRAGSVRSNSSQHSASTVRSRYSLVRFSAHSTVQNEYSERGRDVCEKCKHIRGTSSSCGLGLCGCGGSGNVNSLLAGCGKNCRCQNSKCSNPEECTPLKHLHTCQCSVLSDGAPSEIETHYSDCLSLAHMKCLSSESGSTTGHLLIDHANQNSGVSSVGACHSYASSVDSFSGTEPPIMPCQDQAMSSLVATINSARASPTEFLYNMNATGLDTDDNYVDFYKDDDEDDEEEAVDYSVQSGERASTKLPDLHNQTENSELSVSEQNRLDYSVQSAQSQVVTKSGTYPRKKVVSSTFDTDSDYVELPRTEQNYKIIPPPKTLANPQPVSMSTITTVTPVNMASSRDTREPPLPPKPGTPPQQATLRPPPRPLPPQSGTQQHVNVSVTNSSKRVHHAQREVPVQQNNLLHRPQTLPRSSSVPKTSEENARFLALKPHINVLTAHASLASTIAPSFAEPTKVQETNPSVCPPNTVFSLHHLPPGNTQTVPLQHHRQTITSIPHVQKGGSDLPPPPPYPGMRPEALLPPTQTQVNGLPKTVVYIDENGQKRLGTLETKPKAPVIGRNNYLDVHASNSLNHHYRRVSRSHVNPSHMVNGYYQGEGHFQQQHPSGSLGNLLHQHPQPDISSSYNQVEIHPESSNKQNLATVYTNQVTQSQIEQFKQQLYSDVDYVIYPMRDPAISKQEYLDAKEAGSLMSDYSQMNGSAPPPPYSVAKPTYLYQSSPNISTLPPLHVSHGYPSLSTRFAARQNMKPSYSLGRLTRYNSAQSLSSSNYSSTHYGSAPSSHYSAPSSHYSIGHFSDHLPVYGTKYMSNQSLSSHSSNLSHSQSYSASTQSLSGSYEPIEEVRMALPKMLSLQSKQASVMRAYSNESVLTPESQPPRARIQSQPLPPPPPPYNRKQVPKPSARPVSSAYRLGLPQCSTNGQMMQPYLQKYQQHGTPEQLDGVPLSNLDIHKLREKSRNLDLPLISALCNDRTLVTLTNGYQEDGETSTDVQQTNHTVSYHPVEIGGSQWSQQEALKQGIHGHPSEHAHKNAKSNLSVLKGGRHLYNVSPSKKGIAVLQPNPKKVLQITHNHPQNQTQHSRKFAR